MYRQTLDWIGSPEGGPRWGQVVRHGLVDDEWVEAESFGQRWLEKANTGRHGRHWVGVPEWRQKRAGDQGADGVGPKKKHGETKKGLKDVRAGSKSRSQAGRERGPGSTRCHSDNWRGPSRLRPRALAAAATLRRGLCAAVPLAYSRRGDFQILIKSALIEKAIILL